MSQCYFQEDARQQGWKSLLLATIVLIPLGYIWMRLAFGNAAEDSLLEPLLLLSVSSLIVLGGFLYFQTQLRLHSEIDEEGIHFQMRPLHRTMQHIPWDEIVDCRIIKTSFWGNLSGWGIEFSSIRPSYSLSGKNGIELWLRNGQRVFIGTNSPQKLKKVICKKVKLPKRLKAQQRPDLVAK